MINSVADSSPQKFVTVYNSDTQRKETYKVSKEDFDSFNSKRANAVKDKNRLALIIGSISALGIGIFAHYKLENLVEKLLTTVTGGITGYFAGAFVGGFKEESINKKFINNHHGDLTGTSDAISV